MRETDERVGTTNVGIKNSIPAVPTSTETCIPHLEAHLVEKLQTFLVKKRNPFSRLRIAQEFYYQSGRVDIIAKSPRGHLIAFEAKLSRWRDALHQAYRSTSFAHYSYVVLPYQNISIALKAKREFERRGVGLCSVSPKGVSIEIPARHQEPIQPWLTTAALACIIRKG